MNTMVFRLNTDSVAFRYAEGIIDNPEKEFHSENEIYFLWEGQVALISEFGRQHLSPGTAVIVPRETFHQFVAEKAPTPYVRCNLKFGDIPQWKELIRQKTQRVCVLREREIFEIFGRLRNLVSSRRSDEEKRILLNAYLAELLVQLPSEKSDEQKNLSALSPVTRDAIRFIQKHISGDLGLNSIALALNISPSHLSHVFKNDMEISLHRYILNKRLIQANIRIRQGVKPVCAAEACGFLDYSNFYTQYKKRFGHPPSKEREGYIHPEDMECNTQ